MYILGGITLYGSGWGAPNAGRPSSRKDSEQRTRLAVPVNSELNFMIDLILPQTQLTPF